MALVSKSATTHLVPPHEPESWFDVRPIAGGDYRALGDIDLDKLNAGAAIEVSLQILSRVIVAWSYDEEITAENVADLDSETYTWLVDAANFASAVRSLQEKKVSLSGLTPGPAPAPRAGRRN